MLIREGWSKEAYREYLKQYERISKDSKELSKVFFTGASLKEFRTKVLSVGKEPFH